MTVLSQQDPIIVAQGEKDDLQVAAVAPPDPNVQVRRVPNSLLLNATNLIPFPRHSNCDPVFGATKTEHARDGATHPWWPNIKSTLKSVYEGVATPNDYFELLATKLFSSNDGFSRNLKNLDSYYCLNRKNGPAPK